MTEVFELTYHGGGGFTYTEVWNMDVPKRRFNLKKISEYLEKLEEIRNKENNQITQKTDVKKMDVPDFVRNAPATRPIKVQGKSDEAAPSYVSKIKPKK